MSDLQLLESGGFPLLNGDEKSGVMDSEMWEYMLTHPAINQSYIDKVLQSLREDALFERTSCISELIREKASAEEEKDKAKREEVMKNLSYELDICKESLDGLRAIRRTIHNHNFDYADIDDTERILICHINYLDGKIMQKNPSRVCRDVVPECTTRPGLVRGITSRNIVVPGENRKPLL